MGTGIFCSCSGDDSSDGKVRNVQPSNGKQKESSQIPENANTSGSASRQKRTIDASISANKETLGQFGSFNGTLGSATNSYQDETAKVYGEDAMDEAIDDIRDGIRCQRGNLLRPQTTRRWARKSMDGKIDEYELAILRLKTGFPGVDPESRSRYTMGTDDPESMSISECTSFDESLTPWVE